MPNKITYTITTADGKNHQVSEDNINKYGMQSYADAYKDATIRMRDKDGADYDIPLRSYSAARTSGLRPFRLEHTGSKQRTSQAGRHAQQVVDEYDGSEDASKPRTPISQADKNAMAGFANRITGQVGDIVNQTESGLDNFAARANNPLRVRRENVGIGAEPVRIGENPNVVKVDGGYATESGNVYSKRNAADMEQNQIDYARRRKLNPINTALEDAYAERDRLDDAMRRRKEEIDNEKGGIGEFLRGFAEASRQPGMLNPMEKYQTDEQYRQLEAAWRKNRATIQTLENKKNGNMDSFWRGFGETAGNGYTFADGLSEINDAIAIMDARKHIDSINRKREVGQPLTREEEAAESILKNEAINNNVQGQFGGEYGPWHTAGSMMANSLDFMKDIALYPGAGGLAKNIAGKVANIGGKYLAKQTGEAAIKAVPKTIARGFLKGTGMLLGAHTAGAVISNTTGINRTAGAVGTNLAGETYIDENGKLVNDGGMSLIPAIADAERNQIRENGSEMFGTFIPGGVGKFVTKGMEKLGLSKLSNALGNIANSRWYQQYNNLLKAGGFNGIPGEALEEYEGMAFDALTGHAGETWEQLKDPRTHVDIWLGTAAMSALLGAVPVTIQGAHTAQYYRYKHKTNVADNVAAYRFGEDKWTPIREQIDDTPNEKMTDEVMDIINDDSLHPEQKKAALDYIRNLTKMRGFDIAQIANAGNESPVNSSINNSYSEGYNAESDEQLQDINNRYDIQQQQLAQTLGVAPEQVDNVIGDPVEYINTLQQQGRDGEIQAVLDYANAKQAYDGMIQHVQDNIDSQIAQSNDMIDSHVNRDNGSIIRATLRTKDDNGNDKYAYVISGNVVMSPDGTEVDRENSSPSILIVNDEGQMDMVSPDAIISVDEPLDPEEEKRTAADTIRQNIATSESNRIDGTVNFAQGDNYTLTDNNGQTTSIVVMPNKDGIIDNGDGTVNVSTDGGHIVVPMAKDVIQQMVDNTNRARVISQQAQQQAQQPDYDMESELMLTDNNGNPVRATIVSPINEDGQYQVQSDSPINGKKVNLFTADELNSLSYQQPSAGTSATETAEASATQQNASEEQPAGEQAQTALERVPKDESGQPIYEQTDPDTAWDAIVEQTGSDESMAQRVTDSMVADKEAELKKLEKSKPKAGVTINEKIAADKERSNAIEQAKSTLDHWKRIAQVSSLRQQAAMAEQSKAAAEAEKQKKAQQEKERAEKEEAERIRREALNGIPDIVDDKPQDARARGYRKVNAEKVDRQQPLPAIQGKKVQVKFDDKNIPTGHVALIDADQLQPSHINGQRNPLHFIDEAQPKERKDEASIVSARNIAANIRPEEITSSVTAYTGAPTVNSRGEVIQGNNRSAALKEMWAAYPEQAQQYKQHLVDHAADYGLSSDDINAMQHPVLVNMMDVTDDEAIKLGQFVAQDTESGGTERIKPKNVIKKMGNNIGSFANILLKSSDDEATFAQLVDSNGPQAIKWMQAKQYITPTQYNSAFDSNGNLTDEAKNDLKGIMYQGIFQNGNTYLEEMFNTLPAKAQKAILATAFRDYNSPSGERLNEEIQASINAYYALSQDEAFVNATNYKDARAAIESWKRQYAIDYVTVESYLPSEKFSNFALLLAAMYKGQTQRFMQNTFNNIYDLVQGTKEANLFEEPDNTPRSLVDAINETLSGLSEELLLNGNFIYNGQRRNNVLAGSGTTGQPRGQGSPGSLEAGGRIEDGTETSNSSDRAANDKSGGRSGRNGGENQGTEKEEPAKGQLTKAEAAEIIADMEEHAEVAPEIELTIENWDALFGEDGRVNTPLGEVKMGENQFTKLMRQGRNGKLGMVKPTLENPDIIIEDESQARDGDNTERPSSYVFVKTFLKGDGSRYYYFTSITVSKEGREVVVSSQEKSRNRILRLMLEGSVIWRTPKDATTSSAEKQGLDYAHPNEAEDATKGSGITPQSTSSAHKDTEKSAVTQTIGEKVAQAEAETEQNPTDSTRGAASNSEIKVKGKPSLLDVVHTLYTKGKGVASKLFQRSFFDVAQTPKFMKSLGLRGDKFTIRYGVIARHFNKDNEHDLSEEIWEQLPNAIQTPFAITKYFADESHQEQKGYRLYTTLQLSNGSYVVVSAEVKNSGRDLEVNAINTIFGRNVLSSAHDELIYISERITPEQQSLLDGNNPRQYSAERELSVNKDNEFSDNNSTLVEKISKAEEETDVNPTEAQKEAGNYKKGHVRVDGYDITIEQPKGSIRKGTDANGKKWEQKMNNTYGYIRGTQSVDGDHIDIFLSDDPTQGNVYVVDQVNPDGSFDEHKVMYGFNSADEAKDAYLSNYEKGWKGLGTITEVSKDEFKKWINSSHRKTKPFAEYKSVNGTKESNVTDNPNITPGDLLRAYESGDTKAIEDAENRMRTFIESSDDMKAVAATYFRSKDNSRKYKDVSSDTYRTQSFIAETCKKALLKAGMPKEAFMSERKRSDFASNTSDSRILDVMSSDPSFDVLRAVLNNPNTSNSTLQLIADHTQYSYLADDARRILAERDGGVRQMLGETGEKSLSAEETAIRDAVIDRLRKSGFDVITDTEEGQRVLDEANGRGVRVRMQAMLDGLTKAANTIHSWIKGNKRDRVFTIELPESTQRKIKEVMGRDFDSHNITANGIAHALKNHGIKGNKLNKNSIPLREEDAELIPYIMTAPDYVKKASTDISGRESLRFYKELSNGYVVVVEKEYKNSPNDMETITMWAETSSEATNARHKAVPDTHVPNAILSTDAAKIRKDAETAIENDEKIREHRVYHGSAADFEAFDHSHMGEGEGAQAYGWGSYVTEVKGIGKSYATSNEEKRAKLSINEKKEYIKSRKRDIKEMSDYERYAKKIMRNRRNSEKEYKEAKKAGNEKDMKFYKDLMALSDSQLKPENHKALIDSFHDDINKAQAEIDKLEDKFKGKHHLYIVNIPDDTGRNYLDWANEISEEQKHDILNSLSKLKNKAFDYDYFVEKLEDYENNYNLTGEGLYKLLSRYGFDNNYKEASEVLNDIGFTGIKYPAEYTAGGREDGKKNYVIFNEKDLKITNNVRFFKTRNGETYGFTVGGRICIDPRVATPDTPIHEYAHLWASALRQGNPEEWQNVVGLMKDTPVWDEVKRRYPELTTDDDIADEVLATYSGRRGAERLKDETRKTVEGKSVFDAAQAVTAMERVKEALRKFWKDVADFLHIHYTSAEEVADRVMNDLLEGTDFKREFVGSEHDDAVDFARKYNLNVKDVQNYVNYMQSENLNGASRAFNEIRRKIHLDNQNVSLSQFAKIFSPIRNELYKKFGNVDDLRQQYIQRTLDERNVMEAARKKAEEEAEKERRRQQEFQDMSSEQLDAEYMKAVEANDKNRMRDLVNEAARRNGYGDINSGYQGVGAWTAPSNPGYESEEERRKALESDGTDVNVMDVAEGYSGQPNDYFTNLRAYGNDTPHGKESAEAINTAVAEVREGKKPTIKVYRAVPKTVKEGKLRNGDWVTPSRKYAEMHGDNRLEGDYRIIEQDVPAEHLWWDGNDINEWGFDDGQNYAYRNTRNNRKLNDLITRDDKGNIIPLSQRFNARRSDVRFRFIGEKGAARLDAAEEATSRLDNLSTARQMEEAYNEKKARIEKLKDSKPVEITGKEIEPSDDLKQYKKNALEYGKKLQGSYVNKDTGRPIQLQRGRRNGGVNEVLQHDYKDVEHLQSVAAIPQIIENSVYIDSRENTDKEKNPNVTEYQYYVCGLKIGDADYTVRSTIAVDNKGNRYYDHKLTSIEKGKLLDQINGQTAKNVGFGTTPGTKPTTDKSLGKDKVLLSLLQTNDEENARKIKFATGWERGADGKWRYETPDFEYYPNGDARKNDKYKETDWYNELHGLEEKLFNGETLTDEETKRFDELSARVNDIRDNDKNMEHVYLDDYIRDDELFKAYPELKLTRIDFVDIPNARYSARYNEEENRITLNLAKSIDDKSAIAHELQHAIQRIEGFARGSNVDNYRNAHTSENVILDIIHATDGRLLDEGGFDNTPQGIFDALRRKTTYGTILRDYDSQLNNVAHKYGYDTIYDLVNDIGNFKSSVEMYLFEAGEVEARNVEKRYEMTPEQRRESLALETEDVAREDQTFLQDALGTRERYGTDGRNETNGQEAEEANRLFNEELQQLIDGTLPKGHVFELGRPSNVLRSAGVPNLPIEMAASRLSGKSRQDNHPFELSEVKDLPQAIQKPMAVFRSATHIGSYVVMTEIEHNGKNFVVAIETNMRRGRIEVNSIRSVHYRTSNVHMANWITEGLLEYADKGKMAEWFSKQRYNSADVRKLFNHAANIVKNFENPSVGEENLRSGEGIFTDAKLSYENDPVAKLTGNSTRTAEQQRAFAERERERMISRVQYLAKKLHLDNVDIVTDASTLNGRRAKAKGFFNKSTGKITIVIPNQTSVFDAEQTLLHEAVAHYGLRKLFGDHFDTFLKNVFNNADENVRRKIVELSRKHNWDFATATEEYLASLAEDTDFENVNAGWWNKIKEFFLRMLHSIGFDNFSNVTLSDNELRYILWRSYENLAEPGRYRSILGIAEDVTMQSRLGVGNFANPESRSDVAAEPIDEVNRRFNEQLAGLTEENKDSVTLFLGRPSPILRAAGVEDKPMKLYGNKIIKKMKKHGFTLNELKDLPKAVADPIAVFKNYGKEGNRSILTELKTEQGNFLVTLNLGESHDVDFNVVTSVFGKGESNIIDWIKRGFITYINKEKALNYLHHSALRAVTSDNQELISATNIVKIFENPSVAGENLRNGDGIQTDAKLNYENLAEPGRYRSILGIAEDVTMQSRLGVGNFANPESRSDVAAEPMDEVNRRFNEQLAGLTEENKDSVTLFLGRPSPILRAAGVEDKTIKLYGSKIVKKMKKHGFKLDESRNLPEAVAYPIAVFNNTDRPGNRSVLTELKTENGNILVTLDLGKGIDADFDIVSSVFGKSGNSVVHWLNKGFATYIDKEKALNYLHLSAPIAEASDNQELSSATNIVKNFDNPSVEDGNLDNVNDDGVLFRDGTAETDPISDSITDAWDNLANSTAFQLRETAVDYLTAVEKFQDLVAKHSGKTIEPFENAYDAMIFLSSKNREEMNMFDSFIVTPLNKAILKLAGLKGYKGKLKWDDGPLRDLVIYVESKHGIERNRQMAVEAVAKADKQNSEAIMEDWNKTKKRINSQEGLSWTEKQNLLDEEAAKLGADISKDYSGLSSVFKDKNKYPNGWKQASLDYVKSYEENHSKEDIDGLWNAIDNATGFALQKQYESGLVSREYVERQKERFDNYIPLRGFEDEIAGDVYNYMENDFYPGGNPVKTSKGRTSEAGNPFGSILNVAYSSISTGNKNRAKLALFSLVENHDTEGLAVVNHAWMIKYDELKNNPELENLIVTPEINGDEEIPEWVEALPKFPEKATPEEISNILNEFNSLMRRYKKEELAKPIGKKTKIAYKTLYKERNEHEIPLFINGDKYIITITGNPRLAQAMNGLLNPDVNNDSLTEIGKKIQRFMSGALTAKNVSFAFGNLSKDTIYANNQAFIRENPAYWIRFTINQKAGFGDLPGMMSRLHRYYNNKLDLSNKEDRLFHEFMTNGGATGYTFVNSQDEYAKELAKKLKELSRKTPSALSPKGAVKAAFDAIEFAGQSAELVNRFAAYKTSREMGRPVTRAIRDAKEITVNFNRKGAGRKSADKNKPWYSPVNLASAVSQYGSTSILFWNANMQAKYRLYKNLKEHPIKTSVTLIANNMALGAVVVPLMNNIVLPALYNAFGFGGDDDNDDYYNSLTDYERTHNICVRLPEGNWLKIPLSPEMVPWYSIGDAIGGEISGERDMTTADIIHSIIDAVSPLSLNWSYEGSQFLLNFAPTICQPVLQNMMNVNFMGNPIKKEPFGNRDKYKPQYEMVYKNASPTLMELSKLNNHILGGEDSKANKHFDWNPAEVQNLITGYAGGYGQVFLSAADWIVNTSKGEKQAVTFSRMPLVSRFFISGNKDIKLKRINSRFYDVKDFVTEFDFDLKRYENDFIDAKKKGDLFKQAESITKIDSLIKSERAKKYNDLKEIVNATKYYEDYLKEFPDDETTKNLLYQIKQEGISILKDEKKEEDRK